MSDRETSPRQQQLGRAFDLIGTALLPASLGAALGYYASDQNMRWLPTMLGILLLAGFVALLCMAGGRALQGHAYHVTPKGKVLRKRVVGLAALGMFAGVLRLVLFAVQQPSPLTALSNEEFDTTFELDSRSYGDFDRGIEHYLTLLEARPELFVDEHVLTADEEAFVLDCWVAIYDYSFALDQVRIFYEDWYRFDPSRAQRSYHLRSFLLTFASELALYEKSWRVVQLFKKNRNVVKFLDAPHDERELPASSFSEYRESLLGTRDAARVIAGQQYLGVLAKGLGGRGEARSLGVDWLWKRVEHHLSVIDAFDMLVRADKTVSADLELLKRGVRRVWYRGQKGVAEWMGDTRVRRVGWYLIDETLWGPMDEQLEPGDVMLSRKNWYVSNVGLPGFWPHAILYIGAPDKFAAYFDDPAVLAWVQRESGMPIDLGTYIGRRHPDHWLHYQAGEGDEVFRTIEAISEGVSLSPMEHVVGDYVVALRPKQFDKLAKAQAIVAAFDYLDRPYDFDFDFATDHALVCTELVWRAYRPAEGKQGLDIPLVQMAGRPTLPANEMARQYGRERGQADAQFEFVYFIDAIERERRAIVSDEETFLDTPDRTKWDVLSAD